MSSHQPEQDPGSHYPQPSYSQPSHPQPSHPQPSYGPPSGPGSPLPQPPATEWGAPPAQYGASGGAVPYPPSAPPLRAERSRLGAALAVLGLATTIVGAFALPLQTYGHGRAHQSIYAGAYIDIARQDHHDILVNGFAAFWWGYGVYVGLGLLSLAIAWAVLTATRAAGLVLLVLALLGGAAHLVALTGTSDYLRAVQLFRPGGSVLKHAGSGVWVALGGFVVLAIAGLVTTIRGGARTR